MTKYLLIFSLLSFLETSHAQPQDRTIDNIVLYVLPKHSKFKYRISNETIKNAEGVIKVTINKDKKVINYFSGKLFIGPINRSFDEIDVRFLIEISYSDGAIADIGISSTDLVKLNSNIYEFIDQRTFAKVLKKYLPPHSGWRSQ